MHLTIHNLAIVNRHAGAGRALDYPAILKRKSRGVPWTLDCAFHDLSVVKRCAVMGAHGAQCINCGPNFRSNTGCSSTKTRVG